MVQKILRRFWEESEPGGTCLPLRVELTQDMTGDSPGEGVHGHLQSDILKRNPTLQGYLAHKKEAFLTWHEGRGEKGRAKSILRSRTLADAKRFPYELVIYNMV